jgi:hypothetical protein
MTFISNIGLRIYPDQKYSQWVILRNGGNFQIIKSSQDPPGFGMTEGEQAD